MENSSKVHAVTHRGLKQTQLNFFESGSLTYAPGKTITVDKPVNIILDEQGDTPIITLAMSDTSYNETVNVVLTSDNESRTTEFVLDQAPYTGKSMTLVAVHQTNIARQHQRKIMVQL
ncbi:polysaccharide lyase beta-sandwich domain-containing protein [Erysipelothrix sp. D19-032]